jgi:perosamine synthetase
MRRVARTRPYFPEEDVQAALDMIGYSLRTGQLTMGPLVVEFEKQFAAMAGVKHALAVNSGTAALEIVLRCVGVAGRDVIVPTETFVASANAVLLAGGRPVFAEIQPDTLCLDLSDVEHKITPETAAVMLVYMGGLIPPYMDELLHLCERHGLALIEDAAHAHGAALGDRRAGSFGRAGCFSFYATKVMTTAEGGMITTDDDELAALARSLRNHGINAQGSAYVRPSTNWRMSELHAAVGLTQLRRLASFVARRNTIAAQYDRGLANVAGLNLLPPVPQLLHSYWNYLVLLEPGIDRRQLASTLREELGVEVAWPYDPPCHLQPVFRNALGCQPGDLPRSEQILQRHIALPMHVGLSDDDVAYVVASLQSAMPRAYVA